MIVILDFGSQYAHLIARRVRGLGVKAEIFPFDTSVSEFQSAQPAGIILSGGPASVLGKNSPRPDREIFNLGIPIMGICYGQQVMAAMLGGSIGRHEKREYGKEKISITGESKLFSGLRNKQTVWFSHGDQVVKLPRGFQRIASTTTCKNTGMMSRDGQRWGIQFHPEVTHTENGQKIISNFLFKICEADKDWKIDTRTHDIIKSLKEKIGNDHVLIGISGGVDSLVAAALLYKAIGRRLHAVFVNTGLLRKGEVAEVSRQLGKQGFQNLHVIQSEQTFLKRLKGTIDPEKKRKIIGHTFIEIFEEVMKKDLKEYDIQYFAQGTIYPDRIESAEPTKTASKIKSHHNLTLPRKFRMEIIEPLKDLYKDEVRIVGKSLGLPRELLWRHPFPGPGLAVRIIGEVTKNRIKILQEADAIYIDELKMANEYSRIWQAFAVLLTVKSVGVKGDARTYEYMVSLRAVDSIDGMSADWHKMPSDLLERISNRIVREVKGVSRVLYDITQKPPATIEYE